MPRAGISQGPTFGPRLQRNTSIDLPMAAKLKQHFEIVRELLLPLGCLFDDSPKGWQSHAYFLETIDANEFELALHAVCDFVLESTTQQLRTSDLDRIRLAHEKMSIADDCVERLSCRLS